MYGSELIFPDETMEDLQCKGLRLIQKKKGFRFGVDSVLLANFVDGRKASKIVDLGTGTGVIPLLLSAKCNAQKIIGLEIQEDLVRMANRSLILNNLQKRIEILHGDIKNPQLLKSGDFDVVVSNPPYIKLNGGIRCAMEAEDISRHEVLCSLSDVLMTAARLLKPGGQFAMVHKPERIADILCLMRQVKIEPKFLRLVHPKPGKKPNILLVKGVRNGGADLKFYPPLYIHKSNGEYSEEVLEIYERKN